MSTAPLAQSVPPKSKGRAYDMKSEVFPERTGPAVLFYVLLGTGFKVQLIAINRDIK